MPSLSLACFKHGFGLLLAGIKAQRDLTGVKGMYTFDSRVRYSEVGVDGNLTLIALLEYFQDCSTFHSEDIGLGMDYLRELN